MNGLDDKVWSMVDAVVTNDSLQIRSPHPHNASLAASAGGVEKIPRAYFLPDLMRVLGQRYNAHLPANSPARLVRVRLDAFRWPEERYGDYVQFVETWKVEL
jgi:hypothetical protein